MVMIYQHLMQNLNTVELSQPQIIQFIISKRRYLENVKISCFVIIYISGVRFNEEFLL